MPAAAVLLVVRQGTAVAPSYQRTRRSQWNNTLCGMCRGGKNRSCERSLKSSLSPHIKIASRTSMSIAAKRIFIFTSPLFPIFSLSVIVLHFPRFHCTCAWGSSPPQGHGHVFSLFQEAPPSCLLSCPWRDTSKIFVVVFIGTRCLLRFGTR